MQHQDLDVLAEARFKSQVKSWVIGAIPGYEATLASIEVEGMWVHDELTQYGEHSFPYRADCNPYAAGDPAEARAFCRGWLTATDDVEEEVIERTVNTLHPLEDYYREAHHG